MSSYTMTLKETLQTLLVFDNVDVTKLNTKQFIEEGRKKLFNFSYDIFDEKYRPVFETHFIRHFYMREIGVETEGLFQFNLETWMIVNMPYFNNLFKSELLTFDPLLNSRSETIEKRDKEKDSLTSRTSITDQDGTSNTNGRTDSNGTNTSNTNATNKQNTTTTNDSDSFNRDIVSDTPDDRLAITTEDGSGVIQYASKLEENKNNASDSGTSNATGSTTSSTTGTTANTDTVSSNTTSSNNVNVSGSDTMKENELDYYIQQKVGKTGSQSYSEMLQEYRKTFLRIEPQIFKEMQQLFMLVY